MYLKLFFLTVSDRVNNFMTVSLIHIVAEQLLFLYT